ncbi:hypothetical protein LTT02_16870 [Mycolicibacterium smegmatis]|uniref:hypothetical protein n=1 Tax=Mycolicibacterium smegmatis TaxID=1772 RepID=UPI0005D90518|nr:hypothetical protein [Mycolicibacterium smegmatis]MDF1898005.1 hypothetical protein [Mycolicibacterium smegmatis]MDF1904968.1 hypothetical protein [Mycolicibacterium smegmatis]MDF1916764.1 hypothetical protein [Mycolicibacterium smegmatis]MDF1923302.1 hypothetical protein [Mycolicibacterium smegmatis]UAK52734.1 hypothetical protein K8P01_19000 [Mycolicibacterium smegmatis]
MKRLIALGALCCAACGHSGAQGLGLSDDFTGPNGVIAAEGTPVQPGDKWIVTSGTLFRDNGTAWTGPPDESTGSEVFRMVSVVRGFNDLQMSLAMRVDAMSTTARTPAQDYDGAHIWVRYQSDVALYAVSVDRRDATMTIKKKCAGGTDNGGTYYDLNGFVHDVPIPFGKWQHIAVTVRDHPDGSVYIDATRDGITMSAVDDGVGCAPLHGGGVGIRGDNAELRFADISVTSL